MKYESLETVTHEQAEAIARSGDAHALSRITVSVARADADLDWSTSFLLSFAGGAADGSQPRGAPILAGTTLYGTTALGGSSGTGTVFKVNTDRTGFALLHTFTCPS